ncbi:MAG: hypothetical protein IJ274_13085 [Lachnospiraceae bacterium]|nr:hypothetical protein [Lachnospiraceae bacterium]
MGNNKVELMLERTFLFDPNIYMAVIMTLEGEVKAEELCEAVKKAYTQNDMTMSKAVLDENGTFYREEMDKTGCKVFIDQRSWQEIMYENERKTFRVDEGELVRTFIIPKGDVTEIFFMVHHITCDGNGIFLFAEDVFNNLQGKEVAYRNSTVMTKEGVIKKGNLNFLEKAGLKSLSQKWCDEGKEVFNFDMYYKIHKDFWKEQKTEIEFTEIKGSELEEIKAVCKKLGVTVNSYMVTKYMQDYTGRQKLAIPTSIRGDNRSISCMVSSVIAYAEYDADASFEENLVKINKILTKEIKNIRSVYYIPQFISLSEGTLIDASYVQHFVGYESERADRMRQILGLYGKDRTRLGVTNLGVLSIPTEYGKFKITNIIPVAPCVATSEKVVTVSTFNGKMLIANSKIVKK